MRTPELEKAASAMGETISRFKELAADNSELTAELANYICVLLCALLEDMFEMLVVERAKRSNDNELESYIRNAVSRAMRNPNRQNIMEQLKWFSAEYSSRFAANVPANEELHSRLDSIVTTKNSLSHTVGHSNKINFTEIDIYFNAVTRVLSIVEDIVLPKP